MFQSEFALDVREGLCGPGQKRLSPKYFYDDLGVALFEAITLLPEYGLTRADVRVLTEQAPAVAEKCHGVSRVIELGSGTGSKTRPLLAAFSKTPAYYPIDAAASALERCKAELAEFTVEPICSTYIDGLQAALADRDDAPVLLLFLGSTIGNFERDEIVPFLRGVRECLRPGDRFLLGTDLVKEVPRMIDAYDDPAGVTAAFNLNVLGRMNRELCARFNLRQFVHEARYDARWRRIEMHLRSRVEQTVSIPAIQATVRFNEGETIWTESSHKFDLAELSDLGLQASLRCNGQWTDEEWPFAETLYIAQ